MALLVNSSTHLIPALLLIYRPRNDERLSWLSWVTCSGWFAHISGHPSAAGRAQEGESSPCDLVTSCAGAYLLQNVVKFLIRRIGAKRERSKPSLHASIVYQRWTINYN